MTSRLRSSIVHPAQQMGSYAGYLLETFVTLLAVCGLAFVVLYGARRLGIGRPRGPIQLVGQLPLDARRAIYLVQVGNQVLVVGASEAGISRLGEVAATDLPAADPTLAPPFSDVLARVLGTPKKTAKPTLPTTAALTTTPTSASASPPAPTHASASASASAPKHASTPAPAPAPAPARAPASALGTEDVE